MEEEWALPAPIRLKIVQMAHLDEIMQLSKQIIPAGVMWLRKAGLIGDGPHLRNMLWGRMRPPLVDWCNCSNECDSTPRI